MPTILWRRLDTPGHDACRFDRQPNGWCLEGGAAFRTETGPAHLAYTVWCDPLWRTRRAEVRGWIGERAVDLTIHHEPVDWVLAGQVLLALAPCEDLDLGFTPATNLLPLRRLALRPGQAADVPAAWLDPECRELAMLPQRYERRSGTLYRYEAPSVPFEAELEVRGDGFVRRYPGLWEEVGGESC
jgi:uncharacterized protein